MEEEKDQVDKRLLKRQEQRTRELEEAGADYDFDMVTYMRRCPAPPLPDKMLADCYRKKMLEIILNRRATATKGTKRRSRRLSERYEKIAVERNYHKRYLRERSVKY